MTEKIGSILGGTDGYRGEATLGISGHGRINEVTFEGLTHALVERQLELGHSGPVVVAQDTRPSGNLLRQAVINGALRHGDVEVWDLGVAPTPLAQKVAREIGALATVVVTASHNPPGDNGWKGMVGSEKPPQGVVADISRRYWREAGSGLTVPVGGGDRVTANGPELTEWYIQQAIASIEAEFGPSPLDDKLFVVDGAYGAAQAVTPEVLRRLGADVEEFCCDNAGMINDGCGAANLGGLKTFLGSRPDITSHPRFVGALANDGDSDRMMALGVVSSAGELEIVEVNGNHIMGVHADGEPGIVGTEYTNGGLRESLKARGIRFEECANGDAHVTRRLLEMQAQGEQWRRGGEFTGHNIDTDWLPSGDGVRMAAWLAAYAATNEMTFGQIHQDLPLWPEKMRKVRFPNTQDRSAVMGAASVRAALRLASDELGEHGRHIVRPSGTESVIRVWGEGRDETQITRIIQDIEHVIRAQISS